MSMHRQGLAREFADNVVTLKEGIIQHGFPLMMNQEGDRAIVVQ
jgi:hypothetical protein